MCKASPYQQGMTCPKCLQCRWDFDDALALGGGLGSQAWGVVVVPGLQCPVGTHPGGVLCLQQGHRLPAIGAVVDAAGLSSEATPCPVPGLEEALL